MAQRDSKIQAFPLNADDVLGALSRYIRQLTEKYARQNNPEPLQFSITASCEETYNRLRIQNDWTVAVGTRVGPAYNTPERILRGMFVDAAWELSRRGVIYPAMLFPPKEVVRFEGTEFRLSSWGMEWVRLTVGSDVPLPHEFGRFSEHLRKYDSKLGPVYHNRSQEALTCYRAGAHLAACTMAGAAAEAILLKLASSYLNDAGQVGSTYRRRDGRTLLLRQLTSKRPKPVQVAIESFSEVIAYWRDDAAHASDAPIDEPEAFTTLLILLRFAIFADNRWSELTAN
jgi:hypothetical protein